MRVLAAIILIFLPSLVFALELGEVKLYSFLDEPLNAEIELLDSGSFQVEQLLVTLAQAQEFKIAGLTRGDALSQLQFQIRRETSKTWVNVTSQQPIKEPSLEFLIDLIWPTGYKVQGYVFLLDPPPPGALPIEERRSLPVKSQTRTSAILLPNQQPLHQETLLGTDNHSLTSRTPVSMMVVSNLQSQGVSSLPSASVQPAELKAIETSSANMVSSKDSAIPFLATPLASKWTERLLIIAIGLSGTSFLMVIIVLLIRRKKRSVLGFTSQANGASIFSSKAADTLDETEEESFSSPLVYANEMSLKLKLARFYLDINDRENAESLLEDVRCRGQREERDQAEQLLNKLHFKIN